MFFGEFRFGLWTSVAGATSERELDARRWQDERAEAARTLQRLTTALQELAHKTCECNSLQGQVLQYKAEAQHEKGRREEVRTSTREQQDDECVAPDTARRPRPALRVADQFDGDRWRHRGGGFSSGAGFYFFREYLGILRAWILQRVVSASPYKRASQCTCVDGEGFRRRPRPPRWPLSAVLHKSRCGIQTRSNVRFQARIAS